VRFFYGFQRYYVEVAQQKDGSARSAATLLWLERGRDDFVTVQAYYCCIPIK
jgi:hypothetical protein